MRKTTVKEIKMKDGSVVPVGTMLEVRFPKEHRGTGAFVTSSGLSREYGMHTKALIIFLGLKVPTEKTLWNWTMEGYAKSLGGKKVEPDGWDSEGNPSWLLALGYI
jgi:hypothetical protein